MKALQCSGIHRFPNHSAKLHRWLSPIPIGSPGESPSCLPAIQSKTFPMGSDSNSSVRIFHALPFMRRLLSGLILGLLLSSSASAAQLDLTEKENGKDLRDCLKTRESRVGGDFSVGQEGRTAAIPVRSCPVRSDTGQREKPPNPLGKSKGRCLAAFPARSKPAAGILPRRCLTIQTPLALARHSPVLRQPLRMDRGDLLVFRLPSNPSTGYSWSVAASKPALLLQQGEATCELPKSAKGRLGAGGTEVWRFRAERAGSLTLTFSYARVWEKGVPPVRTLSWPVTIRPSAR